MSILTKIGKVFEQVEKLSSPINKARKEFIGLFVSGLIKGRNVQFSEVAAQMDSKVSSESKYQVSLIYGAYNIFSQIISLTINR